VRRRPHVGAILPFERAPEALRLLQGGSTVGKVVLEVPQAGRVPGARDSLIDAP